MSSVVLVGDATSTVWTRKLSGQSAITAPRPSARVVVAFAAVAATLGLMPLASATSSEELTRLVTEALPMLHGQRPSFVVRDLTQRSPSGELTVSTASNPKQSQQSRCVLLDIYNAPYVDGNSVVDGTTAARLNPELLHLTRQRLPCNFKVLWASGRGGALDWLPAEPQLCKLYDMVLLEDEFVMNSFRQRPPSCRVVPLDPYSALQAQLEPLPWAPGERVPNLHGPLVSFHAYTAYTKESQTNIQRWLEDPDAWNPQFLELVKSGHLKLCLKESECAGDNLPYRLMFWEDISSEFTECVLRGITPIFLATVFNREYVERNILLLPYQFQHPEEMREHVETMSSPKGILDQGTRVFMQRQANHILGNLYWRQHVGARALLLASWGFRSRRLLAAATSASHSGAASSGSASTGTPAQSPVAEILVCVMSATANRDRRDLIRQTWGRDSLVQTVVGAASLRVLFFLADDGESARAEHVAAAGDVVLIEHLEESFGTIWMKTAAILKFASDYFKTIPGNEDGELPPPRFLIKCDDDAFLDIDAIAGDLLTGPPVNLLWGHMMALVEPNRIRGDKYFVPHDVYPMQYYPPYARGMAYALSEDLAVPLGEALFNGRLNPFPYREDVSVGLYLLELAKMGEVRVVPRQRKDSMPLDFMEHCREEDAALAAGQRHATEVLQVVVLHRFRTTDAPCLWRLVEERRTAALRMASNGASHAVDFCQCVGSSAIAGGSTH
eukprot:TRINITY_DN25269_c0_g5_i1.p1 TRINITY_DN25269_c0_g5~~TRINITY_DN25269_c0_g5_i1.p1  ORF type:complete len:729 (+),score=93.37 TRINITY_DN25269_c0_g5_i1:213-2399(+)